ncbi:hypothetical protein MUK42_30259 [Musa troglodytarum]|uniref:Gag1-like clamp domain-containing protein n=1 Tax=Musa troglodytarum TaxID=320322 RepID=A0A9E7FGB1_9LILI|nr:hypothetical protein MUK42_30259 [Musa troglodytarum]
MKNDVSNSHSLAMNNSSCSTIINDDAKLTAQNANNIPFINQGAISWNQMRREWVGDRSKRPHRAPREPTISWCATYEDLFSTNQPFSQPIPLSLDGCFGWSTGSHDGAHLGAREAPVPDEDVEGVDQSPQLHARHTYRRVRRVLAAPFVVIVTMQDVEQRARCPV